MQEKITIEPARIPELKQKVDKEFRDWHKKRGIDLWSDYSFFHDKVKEGSYLGFIEKLLYAANESGVVEVPKVEHELRDKLGIGFNPDVFENAVNFVAANEWEEL